MIDRQRLWYRQQAERHGAYVLASLRGGVPWSEHLLTETMEAAHFGRLALQ